MPEAETVFSPLGLSRAGESSPDADRPLKKPAAERRLPVQSPPEPRVDAFEYPGHHHDDRRPHFNQVLTEGFGALRKGDRHPAGHRRIVARHSLVGMRERKEREDPVLMRERNALR